MPCSSTPQTWSQKKYREALVAHAEDARHSRDLLRIRTDVPCAFDLDRFRYSGRLARALLRAVLAPRIPFARDGLRADGRGRGDAPTKA